MPRTALRALGLLVLLASGCHGSSDSDGGSSVDSGPYVVPVDDLDAGNGLRQPNIADTLGPFTGAFDVNGAGRLFALQVDGHLALVVNDPSQSYLGSIDGGHFKSEIAYPELESCGAVTFDGSYADGGYSGTQVFCAEGEQVSGPLVGVRFVGAELYQQDLAWSGAYDATETADPSNTCARVTGSHKLVFGVARDLDGGAVTAGLFGDGLLSELVYGGVDSTSGLLSARALDSSGNATDSFRLFFLVDGGIGGTREADLGTDGGSCVAELQFWGAKR